MPYVAGSNMPGYMPDETPYEHETFDAAKRDIIGQMLNDADAAETEAEAEALTLEAEDVNLMSSPFAVQVGNRVYFVSEV